MTAAFIVSLAVIFIAIVFLALGYVFSSIIITPRRTTWEGEFTLERGERGSIDAADYEKYQKEDFSVTAFDGTTLRARWLFCPTPSKRAVVCAHGYTSNMACMFKYAKLFLDSGFNVLIYDHRRSGSSDGKFTTMGFLERKDLHQMVGVALEKMGEGAVVGTFGESMGAATVILEACTDDRLAFAIPDCPYADLTEQLAHNLKTGYHLPRFPFLNLAGAFTYRRAGFHFRDVSPAGELEAAGGLPCLPMLFVHGRADTFIPCAASEKLYAAKKGPKKLWLCEGAEHAQSINTDRKGYCEVLDEFLRENGLAQV